MSLQIETRQILIWLLLMGFLSRDLSTQRLELVEGKWNWRSSPMFAMFTFLPIFLMAVFSRARSDMWLYLRIFHAVPVFSSDATKYIVTSSEPGFAVYNVLVKTIFGENDTMYRLFIALIHSIPVIVVIRKYSEDYVYSIFMFVALANHLSWMMNGMRQFMAATIIFAATPWIIKKEYLKSVVIVLIASLFHRTALVMIPVIFIVRGEIWNIKTIGYSLLMIIGTYFFAQNGAAFDRLTDSMGYSLSFVRAGGDDGTNPLRVLVHAVPMILAFIFREGLRKDNNSVINICVNMSVVTTGIYLISMVTSGIMVGRMPIYTNMYNLILLPYIVNHCFCNNVKKFVFLGSIIFYLLFLYIETGGI